MKVITETNKRLENACTVSYSMGCTGTLTLVTGANNYSLILGITPHELTCIPSKG